MHPPSVPGEFSPCMTLRARVLVIAVVSRIVCLFLVSQWPHYFHTYHTSSELLRLDVPSLQDSASWRTATRSEGANRTTWNLFQGDTVRRGHRWCRQSCQELPTNAHNSEQRVPQFTRESIPTLARKGTAVKLLPVILSVNAEGVQVLASAPLHDVHIQTFLAVSDKQNFVPQTTPLTARRPHPVPITWNHRLHPHRVGRRGESLTLPRLSGNCGTQAERYNTDRWLWHLLRPLLSWDAEYFMACAMQRTRYFFEMTHAFFPGLSLTYLVLKELIWPASTNTFPRSPPFCVEDSLFVTGDRCLPRAYRLSEATCYAIIGVILSNVSFILATLGVFEVAVLLVSRGYDDASEAATAHNDMGLSTTHSSTCCVLSDRPVSMLAERMVGAVRQRQMRSSPSFPPPKATNFKKPKRDLENWSVTRSSPTASTQHDKRETQKACFDSSQNQIRPQNIAYWAAFWYAFSGASVHMSAVYTESFFACLSIWGLVLLLRAEDLMDHVGRTKSSQLRTAESRRAESIVQLPSAQTQYGSRSIKTVTHRGDLLRLDDLPTRNLLLDGREATHHERRRGVATIARRYCFSWTATILFCVAALLRSNGTLSLIPLFFYTLRTCPGICRVHALFSRDSFNKLNEADGGMGVVPTTHSTSSAFRSRLSLGVLKLSMAVLVHWVNALLQATVVLLASFLVLAYPYYLYCACRQTPTPAHVNSDARSKSWTNQDHHCHDLSRFPGQRSAVPPSAASTAPSISAQTLEVVQTDNSYVFPVCASFADYLPPPQCIINPPSFFVFAQSVLRVGLPYSLRILSSSMTASPVIAHRMHYAPNPYAPAVGCPEEAYTGQYKKFVSEASRTASIQHVLLSESSHPDAAYSRPAWCAYNIPNVYSSVQLEYWGVEFLGFLRVETLYLIIMSLPFYAVSVLCVIHFLARCRTSLEKSRATTQPPCRHPTQCQQWRSAEEGQRRRYTSVKNQARFCCEGLLSSLLKRETGHVLQLAVLSIVMFFFAHSNVFVRLSTACPVYFLAMARSHVQYTEAVKRANEQKMSRRRVSASSTVEHIRRRDSCEISNAHELMRTLSIVASEAKFRQCARRQSSPVLGGYWWEWCSAFALLHHFLGPLLFGCFITWT